MNRKRLAIVGVAVAVAILVVALVVRRQRRLQPAQPAAGAHEPEGVDYRMSPFLAMMNAPEGKTTCETVYNAFRAFEDASKEKGMTPRWPNFPDQATFLARCNALPPNVQQCMTPRYAAKHHPECDPINDKYDTKNPLFEPSTGASASSSSSAR